MKRDTYIPGHGTTCSHGVKWDDACAECDLFSALETKKWAQELLDMAIAQEADARKRMRKG